MVWIVGADIDKNVAERRARLQYIKEVSGDKYISWEKKLGLSSKGLFEYYQCITRDGINGTYITAHNYIVVALCELPCVAQGVFVVANTCKLVVDLDEKLLQQMQSFNGSAQLYYAKQEREVIAGREYDSNVIRDIGVFGFKTSKSERILYRNREKDFMEAIRIAFDRVIV